MEEITIEEFKKHIRNIVNCLINLAPSRNRFTQMIFLLPKNLGEMTETYPHLFSKEGLPFLIQLGIRVGEKVDIEPAYGVRGTSKIFADNIRDIVNRTFELFRKEEVRKVLGKWLEMEIPDLRKEWFKQKLQIVFSEPTLGEDAKRVLKTMSEKSSSEYWWSITIDDLERETGISKDRLYVICDFLEEFDIAKKYSPDGIQLSDIGSEFKEVIKEMLV